MEDIKYFILKDYLVDEDHVNFCDAFNYEYDFSKIKSVPILKIWKNIPSPEEAINIYIPSYKVKYEKYMKYLLNQNWKRISRYCYLQIEFVEKFKNFIIWRKVSKNRKIARNKKFLERFKNEICWKTLCNEDSIKLPENIIEKYVNEGYFKYQDIEEIIFSSNERQYSLNFLIKHKHELNLKNARIYQHLSLKIIEPLKDYLNWDEISRVQDITITFARKYKNYINWSKVSKCAHYHIFTHKFLEEFKDYLNWDCLSHLGFIRRVTSAHWRKIHIKKTKHRFQKSMENFIEKFSDHINWDIVSETFLHLSHEFIIKHKNKLNLDKIVKTQHLSIKTIKELKNQLNMKDVSRYQKLSENLIEEFVDEVDWYHIVLYHNEFSKKFIKKFAEKLNKHYGRIYFLL